MKTFKISIFLFLFLFGAILNANAKDIKFIDTSITDADFEKFVEDVGSAFVFSPLSPAVPMGLTGFDASVELTVNKVNKNAPYWDKMAKDVKKINYLPFPRIHLQKGLLADIDVGAMYLSFPGTNASVFGVEVKKGVLTNLSSLYVLPSFALRFAYSQLTGVDDLDFKSGSVDFIASKKLLFITPYLGISYVMMQASENSYMVNLKDVDKNFAKGFGGLQISMLPFVKLNFEASSGLTQQYSMSLGLYW